MSLLEDILHVLRMVLEYFGAPPEMLVPVWDCELCGQYRSIVRMIGTNLPLQPPPRVHFQIPLISHKPQGYVDVSMDTPTIPSFADILWVCEDEGNSSTRTRNHLLFNMQNTVINRNVSTVQRLKLHQNQRDFSSMKPPPDPDALKKISALETELLKLRAQIALIVTAPLAPDLECAPVMSPPALASTPLRPPAPLPPPPPPLPPSCPSTSAPFQSVSELIKARKQNHDNDSQKDSTMIEGRGLPSMLDVLKDLNQVKLRSVQRSPGGTPVRKRRSKGGIALHSDPAALIADALKRKFAHHHHNNSSDKENSRELSPFSSPETPKFIHHRRSQGRRYM
ncbi:hypothetical protein NQD34_017928 [Periophthalmus magnuspinnatus]|uniref:mitochondrial fission regulator 2 n=1 Tax=Periophthalmus magnuspinnatus TaxID=409849 RepID=UPI00145C1263|nr:mitochondrial fission regulator 2 [Periophthalmus magnuspinnatus]KAJ0026928.1 hypothetical protein NQD34_017928 [Periophthalmus magnuspinnatus]